MSDLCVYRVANNPHDNKLALISWVLALLLPLFSLPLVLVRMYRLERGGYIQFALLMGLVGILYPPSGDLYRYYKDFNLYQGLSWDTFLLYALLNFDYILSFLSYFLSELNLNFDLTRFIYNFLGYLLLGKLFLNITEDNKELRDDKVRGKVFIVFMVISLSNFLFRFGLSIVLFVYGAYHIIYRKERKYWIYVVLSVLNHFSFIILAIILLLSKSVKLRFNRPILWLLFILMFVSRFFIDESILGFLPFSDAVFDRYHGYVDGYEANEIAKDFSLKYMIWQNFEKFVGYILLFFFIKNYNRGSIREKSFINYIYLLCVVSSPFYIMYGRFISVFSQILKIFFLSHLVKVPKMAKQLSVLFVMIIMLDIMNLYGNWRQISISDMHMLAYKTSFQIIGHTYSPSWVDKNISSVGEIIKYAD